MNASELNRYYLTGDCERRCPLLPWRAIEQHALWRAEEASGRFEELRESEGVNHRFPKLVHDSIESSDVFSNRDTLDPREKGKKKDRGGLTLEADGDFVGVNDFGRDDLLMLRELDIPDPQPPQDFVAPRLCFLALPSRWVNRRNHILLPGQRRHLSAAIVMDLP
jgi:hypothetical protein